MPNYCHNLLRIDGEDEVLDQLAGAVADDSSADPDHRFSYARISPVVDGEDEGEAWGSTSLYCLEVKRNWRGSGLIYEFQSSWDPPMAVIEQLAKQWPALTFELVWVEPLTSRWGTRFYSEGARQRWNEAGFSGFNNDDWEMRMFLESEWPALAEKWWEDDYETEYDEDEEDDQENPYYVADDADEEAA